MSHIKTQHIQVTVDYLRKCVAEQRADQARHRANGNIALENWYEGRADAFDDVARWLERDLRLLASPSNKAA